MADMTETILEPLLNARDVMAICRVGRTAAYEIMAEIPETIRIPGGLRVRRDDLRAWIEERRQSQISRPGLAKGRRGKTSR